jgi:bifunctional non-homologous end joining protein LigD
VILDGEGVICGPDGVSDFDRMRGMFSRKGSSDVFLYAFDVLELDGRDLRAQRWDERRSLLTQLLDHCQQHGIRLSEHVADADGAAVFQQACVMGLEGIVAKRAIAAIAPGAAANGLRSRTARIPRMSAGCSSL